jgi:hypothetical protein
MAFVVSFNVKFVHPNDFVPYISAAVGYRLSPGGTAIVKAKRPASLVPAVCTQVSCLARVHHPK